MPTIKEQVQNVAKRYRTWQIAVGVIAVLAVIVGLVYLIVSSNSRSDYAVLYNELSAQDAGKIAEKLKESKVQYKLEDGGSTILVPKDQVYETRIQLASEGLPESNLVGYEIFDNTNLGMSDFVQKLNYRRAMEGELARTINSLEEVKSSRVHIVIPEKALFKEDQKEPTASVTLQLKPGKTISNASILGIQNLIAKSVEGLNPDNVTIIDYRGKIISQEAIDKNSIAGLTASQQQMQMQTDQYLTQKVQSLLDNVLGVENSSAKVTSDLNFTQIERTITDYDPNRQVIRSEQNITEKSQATDSLNFPAVNSAKDQSNTITNYEIPQTVERIVNEVGNINRITVSVLVNGKTQIVEKNGTKTLEYTPRTSEELEQLTLAVKNAVGFDPLRNDQISVLNVPFDNTYYEELLKENKPVPFIEKPENQKLILLIVIILISVFFMYRLLHSKIIRDRIRIAMNLPKSVELRRDEEVGREMEFEDLKLSDEDLLLMPAALPEQLMLGVPNVGEENTPELSLSELGQESLMRGDFSKATSSQLNEDRMMKIEMKKKIEEFIDTKVDEGVRLVRLMMGEEPEKEKNKSTK
ncbi:MAG TPA: flagellar basal-body MS-ring/collar protein FliF [Candidatus Kapabacteria bacterium]|nr:flagellar basal-body MS-ring/collar protein FliF [Candidatus Kapabacteria bacterium]